MLDKIDRQHRIVETLARNTMTGDMKNVAGWPGNEGDDAMGVNIGDHIHYHQAPAQTPASPEITAQPVVSASTKSILFKWLPYLLAVAGATGGYFAGEQQTPTIPPQQPASVSLDKDIYGITLEHYTPEASK